MNEILRGVIDGSQPSFASLNPIEKHLVFVDGAHQLAGQHYDIVSPYVIQFRPAFVPQPAPDGSAPLIVIVHL